MKRRRFATILLILSAVFAWSGCKPNALSDSEQTAIRFYKAVWVSGDLEKAVSMLQDRRKAKDLKWRVEETKKIRPSNSAIFITESPQDLHILSRVKTYLIYREADKKDYKVEVKSFGGKWKVMGFQQGYSLRRGGYSSFETYERLSYEHPHTDWKKIENP